MADAQQRGDPAVDVVKLALRRPIDLGVVFLVAKRHANILERNPQRIGSANEAQTLQFRRAVAPVP